MFTITEILSLRRICDSLMPRDWIVVSCMPCDQDMDIANVYCRYRNPAGLKDKRVAFPVTAIEFHSGTTMELLDIIQERLSKFKISETEFVA